MTEQTLIESSKFPIDRVNKASAKEKQGGGRPKYWEMVFWWTRKPLASARATIAASLLPCSINPSQFLKYIFPSYIGGRKLYERTPHRDNPKIPSNLFEKYIKGKKLLDPFAGFGSIPLEAVRLGLEEVVAVELLPTAYVFLKAILDYPHRQRDDPMWLKLTYDIKKWGRWIVEKLREDPDIKELYNNDVMVYIGTWEIECPACHRYTPLVGNWWLARVKNKKRYAWMDWDKNEDRLKIIDINKKFKDKPLTIKVSKRKVIVNDKTFIVRERNIEAKSEIATCLHCGATIDHRVVNGHIMRPVGKKKVGEWYIKHALRMWNENLEKYLNGEIDLAQLLKSPARPTILVRVKAVNNDLQFERATEEDIEKLWKALEKLKEIWGDPDIPTEPIPAYERRQLMVCTSTGACKWYKLFNPRQLLTIVKLVKLIREAGKKVEDEKQREGYSEEEAHIYAEAVTTYLAIALVRLVNFNSLATTWYSGSLLTNKAQSSLSFRGLAMTWNWCDTNILYEKSNQYSVKGNIDSIIRALNYLIHAVSDSPSRVRVLLDDAAVLSKLDNEKFDIIVTDPPYADDVPYTELSDFYYVWLKRALSDIMNDQLKPRFIPEAFFDEFGLEIETQWKVFAMREVSENKNRREYFKLNKTFNDILADAFNAVLQHLKPGGVLVTYYVAKKQDAWIALIDALWRRLGLVVTAAYPMETEMEESVVARGKSSVLGGFIIVWRRRDETERADSVDLANPTERTQVVDLIAKEFNKYRSFKGLFFIFSFIAGLSVLTRYREVRYGGVPISVDNMIVAASSIGFEGALKSVGINVKDPYALAYLLLKLATKNGKVTSDELAYVTYATGLTDTDMVKAGLITPTEVSGSKVAKRKTFAINMPASDKPIDFAASLSKVRGKSRVLEALRELQLGTLTLNYNFSAAKQKYGDVIDDVLALCIAFVKLAEKGVLNIDDPDVKTAKSILNVRIGLI